MLACVKEERGAEEGRGVERKDSTGEMEKGTEEGREEKGKLTQLRVQSNPQTDKNFKNIKLAYSCSFLIFIFQSFCLFFFFYKLADFQRIIPDTCNLSLLPASYYIHIWILS